MKEAMYKELAKYYDYIYHEKNYAAESEKIISLIKKYKKSPGKKLLEVACGTGKHLQYLKKSYECTGIDLNKEMLAIAKQKVRGVKYHHGDMINFHLKKQFDIITCLFSSIGYVKTYANLEKTIKNFYRHLKDGGVLIIEPWLIRKVFKNHSSHLTSYISPELVVARVGYSYSKKNISTLEMHYLISEKNKGVKYYHDKHEMGLFDIDKTLEIIKNTGFDAKFVKGKNKKDRGRYIAVKK